MIPLLQFTICPFACTFHPDHFNIAHEEGTIGVGLLVKVKTWVGPHCVLQFVAQNHWDMVAECEGQDGMGGWIVCFIIASH